MKQFFFSVILGISLWSCTEKKVASAISNSSDEKNKIMTTITNESRAFYKKDYDTWTNYYAHSPQLFFACVEKDVTLRAEGWDDLAQFVATWMKENPEPIDYEKAQFKTTEVKTTIHENMAFVTFKSSHLNPDSSVVLLNESRTLQKEKDTWKIISMASYPSDSPAGSGSTPNVYVHQAAK